MGPEGYFRRHMHQPEMSTLCLPRLTLMCIFQEQMEEGVVVPSVIVLWPGRELLVRGHERGGDIVCEEDGLSVDVQELDNIVVADDTATPSLRKGLGGNDLPVVVRVGVTVTGNLLT